MSVPDHFQLSDISLFLDEVASRIYRASITNYLRKIVPDVCQRLQSIAQDIRNLCITTYTAIPKGFSTRINVMYVNTDKGMLEHFASATEHELDMKWDQALRYTNPYISARIRDTIKLMRQIAPTCLCGQQVADVTSPSILSHTKVTEEFINKCQIYMIIRTLDSDLRSVMFYEFYPSVINTSYNPASLDSIANLLSSQLVPVNVDVPSFSQACNTALKRASGTFFDREKDLYDIGFTIFVNVLDQVLLLIKDPYIRSHITTLRNSLEKTYKESNREVWTSFNKCIVEKYNFFMICLSNHDTKQCRCLIQECLNVMQQMGESNPAILSRAKSYVNDMLLRLGVPKQ